MQLDVDVAGRRVVVFGPYRAARRAIRRFAVAGARVTAAGTGPDPRSDPLLADVRLVSLPSGDDTGLLELVAQAWLVVTVGMGPGPTAAVRRAAAQLRILVTEEPAASETGRVTLVGGGPGSTPLLTLAACAALRDADVICFDRLAPNSELDRLAPGAELIDVGKTPYHHRYPQAWIEDLLIERARRGQSVVRLKGGDPFVFGRGSEELIACTAAGIAVHVVPGVSSVTAVPAAAGIPLTHRGTSHAFAVISGHVPPTVEEYAALVGLGGTVLILMGVANLTAIVSGLGAAGLPRDTPAAIVEHGWSDSQRTTRSTLGQLAADARRLGVSSPAVIIVGDVARLGGEVSTRLPADVLALARSG